MTTCATLKLGRINANEDEAKLIEVAVKDGQRFRKDDLILTLETTKTAVDVHAPSDGKMIAVKVEEGVMLSIGTIVFEAEFEGDIGFEVLERVDDPTKSEHSSSLNMSERKASLKAEILAKSLGIDIILIPASDGILKENDVRDFARRQNDVNLYPKALDKKDTVIPYSALPASAMKAIIVGAGGHAKSIHQMIREAGYSIAGVVDSEPNIGSNFLNAYPILGSDADLKAIRDSGISIAFVGICGVTTNEKRVKIFNKLKDIGFVLPPLVSKLANLDPTSHLGEATYVFPGATVSADCIIGKGVVINQGSIVSHDCRVGDYVHLAPGAILAGTVTVGSGSTIGMASTIMNNVTVGANVLVHNTVPVARDIPSERIVTINGIIERK